MEKKRVFLFEPMRFIVKDGEAKTRDPLSNSLPNALRREGSRFHGLARGFLEEAERPLIDSIFDE